MNKPLVILGIILSVIGGIGIIYILELAIALIFGITLIIVGIGIDIGKFSKKSLEGVEVTEFCPRCGSAIEKGTKFCPYCREKL